MDMHTDSLNWLATHADKLREVNRKIWALAEPPLKEYQSSATLVHWLEENEFEVQKGVGGMPTAFVASYGEGAPIVGILAEYDALPGISQEATAERKLRAGTVAAHACGHSLFGTASTAAALAVKESLKRHQLKGTIRLYGSPAEETGEGKMYMALAGAYQDADILLAWHPGSVTQSGFEHSKAILSIKFTFHGVSAHASTTPHLGKSALDAVELMNVGVNYLREHVSEDTRMHYVITDGGGQPNVVPPRAQVWYYLRANKYQSVHRLFERVLRIAQGAALMTDTTMEYEFTSESPEVLPNRPLAELMHRNLQKVGAPRFSDDEKAFAAQTQGDLEIKPAIALSEELAPLSNEVKQGLYSTDLGWLSWLTPTGSLTTACYTYGAAGHSWQIVACSGGSIGEKGLMVAAKALALSALDALTDSTIIPAARADFDQRKHGLHFETKIPKDKQVVLPD